MSFSSELLQALKGLDAFLSAFMLRMHSADFHHGDFAPTELGIQYVDILRDRIQNTSDTHAAKMRAVIATPTATVATVTVLKALIELSAQSKNPSLRGEALMAALPCYFTTDFENIERTPDGKIRLADVRLSALQGNIRGMQKIVTPVRIPTRPRGVRFAPLSTSWQDMFTTLASARRIIHRITYDLLQPSPGNTLSISPQYAAVIPSLIKMLKSQTQQAITLGTASSIHLSEEMKQSFLQDQANWISFSREDRANACTDIQLSVPEQRKIKEEAVRIIEAFFKAPLITQVEISFKPEEHSTECVLGLIKALNVASIKSKWELPLAYRTLAASIGFEYATAGNPGIQLKVLPESPGARLFYEDPSARSAWRSSLIQFVSVPFGPYKSRFFSGQSNEVADVKDLYYSIEEQLPNLFNP